MAQYYDYNYTESQVQDILDRLRDCIEHDNYQISMSEDRQENAEFRADYGLKTDEAVAKRLLEIKVHDFCGSLKSRNEKFKDDILYVFAPQMTLTQVITDEKQTLTVYVKFDILQLKFYEHTVIISFHKLNKPIRYCFRQPQGDDSIEG